MFRKTTRNIHKRIARRLRQEYFWSIKSIARLFGVSDSLVFQWLKPYRVMICKSGVGYIGEGFAARTV